ncbi:sigma 54 modulation/S30EA ribosomal C-terminal domain-containing protein [Nocardia higoensis]|uniref:sigma 54 modulation/S30EA ribosomal C-terminal domain-containing protein n=1 Tax=Nocardia higoensis TaxID=228599 RepID=UPI000318E923|nr:sigma 54 modulation/S30EA ribosomal C-terminal domain-containing protein [Nocardia higoensis]
MPENSSPSPLERRRLAEHAMESAGASPEVLLTVRCPHNHHVAAVLDTAQGPVYRSVVGSHAHGERDFVDTGHGAHQRGTVYADLLSAEDPRDDALPGGCECGPSTLSRARLQQMIAEGEHTAELAAAQTAEEVGRGGEAAPEHAAPEQPVRVSTGRYVSAAGADYAREKIGHALAHAPAPVLSARVRLSGHGDPAVSLRVVAQVVADVGGRAVRVQVEAATTREAVDLLQARLKARLAAVDRRGESIRRLRASHGEHEWRHGDAPRPQLPYYPRPPETREVVRHKAYALAQETCGAAAAEAEALDYDFHLFVEAGSGADSVLYRTPDGSYRLAQVAARPEAVVADLPGMTMSPIPPPELTVEEAASRLELADQPFVFFHDKVLGRGCVLYHRYDGHLGLITPAD